MRRPPLAVSPKHQLVRCQMTENGLNFATGSNKELSTLANLQCFSRRRSTFIVLNGLSALGHGDIPFAVERRFCWLHVGGLTSPSNAACAVAAPFQFGVEVCRLHRLAVGKNLFDRFGAIVNLGSANGR